MLLFQADPSAPKTVPIYQLAPEYLLVYLLPVLSRIPEYRGISATPTKRQIRCLDLLLNEFLQENNEGYGLIAAILAALSAASDRLKPGNGELARLTMLTSQLLQKRIAAMKTVDVGYAEVVRLPAQYYVPRKGKRVGRRTSEGGEPKEKRTKL